MSTRPGLHILVKGLRLGYPDFLKMPASPLQRPNDYIVTSCDIACLVAIVNMLSFLIYATPFSPSCAVRSATDPSNLAICRCNNAQSCALIPERDKLSRRRLWVSASCSTSLSVFVPIFILYHEMCMSMSRHERCQLGVSVIRARYARVRTKEREDAGWGYMLQRACTKERTKENRWRKGEGGQRA